MDIFMFYQCNYLSVSRDYPFSRSLWNILGSLLEPDTCIPEESQLTKLPNAMKKCPLFFVYFCSLTVIWLTFLQCPEHREIFKYIKAQRPQLHTYVFIINTFPSSWSLILSELSPVLLTLVRLTLKISKQEADDFTADTICIVRLYC